MNLKDMTDLIHIGDGVEELEEALTLICNAPLAAGYDEGALGKFGRVFDLIWRNCKLYDPEADRIEDVRDEEGRNVMDILALEIPAEERAKMLV